MTTTEEARVLGGGRIQSLVCWLAAHPVRC